MNKTIKYLSLTLLLPAFSCTEMEPETVEPAVLMEEMEIVLSDEMREKIYRESGVDTYPMIAGESAVLGYASSPDESELTFTGVSWSSSNPAVAVVDDDGTVTALSEGYTIITLSPATVNEVATATLRINVFGELVRATSIAIFDDSSHESEVRPGLPSCYEGETMQLTTAITPSDATYRTVRWSSGNPEIATVDQFTGLVTGVSSGEVTITATSLDPGSQVTASHTIFIDEIINPIGMRFTNVQSDGTALLPLDLGTFEVEFDTWPESSTRSMIAWTCSDPNVATVENGVITLLSYGTATITATCPESESSEEGYEQEVSFTINVPQGYYDEMFADQDNWHWYLDPNHINQGASVSWTEDEDGNYLRIIPYLSSTARGDMKYDGLVLSGQFPVICIRIDDVNDQAHGGYGRNFNIDGSGGTSLAGTGLTYSGNLVGNNRWKTKYSCSDDSAILVYNLLEQAFVGGSRTAFTASEVVRFNTVTLKYADIRTPVSAEDAAYRYFWFKTFRSEEEMTSWLNEWSEETGITYEGN